MLTRYRKFVRSIEEEKRNATRTRLIIRCTNVNGELLREEVRWTK